jgi:phosphotransferase system  glucose/maltose/N-acetylglucosamine-specific IIC component
MLTLLLQLLMTSPSIVSRLQIKRHRLKYAFGGFSFCAIGLQGAALAMIGEALKEINYASGSMLQVCATIPKCLSFVNAYDSGLC